MQLHFTGRNLEVTPALKTYATEKLQRLEKRYSNITKINTVLQLDNADHIAEATVHLSGADIHATAKSNDMYAAIDDLADKLVVQLTKHKEKMTDHR